MHKLLTVDKPVIIVDVWANNLEFEFRRIKSAASCFPFVSMDTEFPGIIFRPSVDGSDSHRSSHNYSAMKANVDSMDLIQLGITLSDFEGNLPDFGENCRFVWQFNFKEFDVSCDPHAPDSIELLRNQGIDFEKNKKEGVDSFRFCSLMLSSGLVFYNTHIIQWVTFHGAYDFAYLLKIITRKPLPEDIGGFYGLMGIYFGHRVYDVKQMIRFCNGVFCGLERVATIYGLKRIAGNAHCAGSDSLLTWTVFQKIIQNNKGRVNGAGVLFGLEMDSKPMPLIRCQTRDLPLHPCYGVLCMHGIPGFIDMGLA